MTPKQEAALLQDVADLRRRLEAIEQPSNASVIRIVVNGHRLISGGFKNPNGYTFDLAPQDIHTEGMYLNTGEGQLLVIAGNREALHRAIEKAFPL